MSTLIEALNKGDDVSLASFVKEFTAETVPAEERVRLLKNLARNGAPFKLERELPERPGEERAVVSDKSGEKMGWVIALNEQRKLFSLRIGPPEELDAPPPRDYAGWKDLGSLCKAIQADTKSPAMAIAMIHEGKIEKSASGVREVGKGEAVATDDPFSIGSVGKPICSTVIGKLIEMGRLRWDTTLGEALADVPMKNEYKGVTLEQLMEHRGGIPQVLGMTGAEVERIVGDEKDPLKIRTKFIKDVLGREPIAKPGERMAYSNAGYAILGVIAERAMGRRYESLVKEFVFQPLGLKHSYTSIDPLPINRPHGHVAGPKGLESQDFGGPMEIIFASAGGGMHMSSADMAAFGKAHLDGLRGEDGLLRASSVARLHKGLPADGISYGCGWGIEETAAGPMHGHNGSNGTMRAQLSIFPESSLVVAAFVNCGGESEPSPPLQAAIAIGEKFKR